MSKLVDLSWTSVINKGNEIAKWLPTQKSSKEPQVQKVQPVSIVPPLPFKPNTKERFLDTETKLHIKKCSRLFWGNTDIL